MGSIRFLLAAGVVCYHSYHIEGFSFCGGRVSVELFFLISGFYMALILNEKYKPGKAGYKLFLSNRFLRLYPPYLIVLLLAVMVSTAGYFSGGNSFYLGSWISSAGYLSFFSIAVLLLLNLTILGQDVLLFTCWSRESGELYFTDDPYLCKPMTANFLFIPQAWSIGIEIVFYLLAPLLTRTKWQIHLLLLIMSLGIRFWTYRQFYDLDPWSYRFFPSEIVFFMAGSLAYKIYARMKHRGLNLFLKYFPWLTFLTLIVSFSKITFVSPEIKTWGIYTILFLFLPFIFHSTQNLKWDQFLGDLSYPLYIGHHLVVLLVKPLFWGNMKYLRFFGITSLVASILLAVLLLVFLIKPFDKVRRRRFSSFSMK